MEIVSVTQGAQRLDIDLKTFRRWFAQAGFPIVPHPGDARMKCVEEKHLVEVAKQHQHLLHTVVSDASQTLSLLTPANSGASLQEDYFQQFPALEARVATLQEQISHLALAQL